MNWERLSLIVPALVAPALFFVLQDPSSARWPLAGLLAAQGALAVLTVALIAHAANWLVESACRIAHALGLSHLVIGLTVVAFGTSAPEVAASLVAGFQGNGDLAVANVVGSNVFNLCFILGGVAILMGKTGLETDRSLVRRDGPMLLLGTVLLFLFVGALPGVTPEDPSLGGFMPHLLNRHMERGEGIILLSVLVAYFYLLYRSRVSEGALATEAVASDVGDEGFGEFTLRDIPMFLLGLGVVVGGCQVLVGEVHHVGDEFHGYGALWFARVLDVPDYVVGVTIVAAGTSAPELVVSLVAAVRGAHGLSAGNLVGSDIFNFYGVLGLAGALLQPPVANPVTVSPQLVAGVAMPIFVVLCAIAFMHTGMRISRREGGILLLIGVARWAFDLGLG